VVVSVACSSPFSSSDLSCVTIPSCSARRALCVGEQSLSSLSLLPPFHPSTLLPLFVSKLTAYRRNSALFFRPVCCRTRSSISIQTIRREIFPRTFPHARYLLLLLSHSAWRNSDSRPVLARSQTRPSSARRTDGQRSRRFPISFLRTFPSPPTAGRRGTPLPRERKESSRRSRARRYG